MTTRSSTPSGLYGRPTIAALIGLCLLAISGCGDGKDGPPTGPTPAPVASVTVSPDAATVPIDGSVSLTATTKDADGNTLTDRAVQWSSLNPTVAEVDATGRVSGVATGSARVTATSEGVTGGADISVVVLDPAQFELIVVSGDGQSGFVGTMLEEPLVVRVRNRDTGAARAGIPVEWRVVAGSAELTRGSSVTNQAGEATTRVVLGVSGAVEVVGEVIGLQPVTFDGLTALPAPSIQSLSPTSADPGDIVEVRVDDLPAGMPAEVLFDGVIGEVTSRQDGAPAVLRSVVPPPAGVCAGAVEPVQVRVRAGGLTTAPRTLDVSVPQDPFLVGTVLVIEGTTDVQCALLPAGGGDARYLLVALSAEFEQAGQFEVTLGASSIAIASAGLSSRASAELPRPSQAMMFHERLRSFERELVSRAPAPSRPPSEARLFAAPPRVGDTRQFWVLNDTGGLEDGITQEDFDRVTATLKFVGVHTLLFIDDAAPESGLTQADIDDLGEAYDRILYESDVDYFGEPTDVDGNDRVVVLLTPTLNALTPPGQTGVIIGFFFGLDLFPPNLGGCPECQFSNGAELLYGLVPDPDGQFSDPRTRERVLQVLPGVMVHETQHMISFRYKVFESSLPELETLWLSEGLAHIAEELAGDLADAGGDGELALDLYREDFDRAARYLVAPETFALTATTGQGSLGERGGWWLFLRWIGDQYGDFVFRELTQAPATGVANVGARTGESFFRLFADWAVAIWADDLTIGSLAPRYQIPKWQLRSILASGTPPEYPLQPLQRTFDELRSTSETRFLAGSSPLFVEVDAAGDSNALQLELTAVTNAGLAILRIQ